MANLQIKGIQEELSMEIKYLAAAENHSVAQQILSLIKMVTCPEEFACRCLPLPREVKRVSR